MNKYFKSFIIVSFNIYVVIVSAVLYEGNPMIYNSTGGNKILMEVIHTVFLMVLANLMLYTFPLMKLEFEEISIKDRFLQLFVAVVLFVFIGVVFNLIITFAYYYKYH